MSGAKPGHLGVGKAIGQIHHVAPQQRQCFARPRHQPRSGGLDIRYPRQRAKGHAHGKIGGVHELEEDWLAIDKQDGCAALALAGGVNIDPHHALDVERYAVTRATPTMPADIWWNTVWQQLPARRIDLTGEIEEPLAVQWAGSLASLQAILLGKGWRVPTPWTPLNTLAWLAADATTAALPVVTRVASRRPPSLTLILQSEAAPNGSRLVLRLWGDLELTSATPSPV
ncbi:LssY C-terminal domain-containing protein [Mesorhizobium captivum]|uniref:LssY C-terminal domain-containing protein n=1 Tax=Mesorhizobium captivum TaxID=3072319 RepID=UPI002A246C34|nr:LssY C-terminal domain-containing protein [Mesorhizobium sp. VK3C]MDX8449411.1 LssY C-terminal domain-containing protein [Mesorhizobium sp. VK3C]